ncbi:E3 ubiquitin-protein ligase MBR1 [Bienertia sinuspersici]
MAADISNSTIGEHLKWRKPRNNQQHSRTITDPNPQMPSIIQSTGCKSTISSLLLSTFTNHENPHNKNNARKSFKNSSLRGFGCTAQPEVTVPAVIRSSADWEEKEKKKKKKKNGKKKNKKINQQFQGVLMDEQIGVQDLWCGEASAAASVDCVRPVSGRGKIDLDKLHQRERASYTCRQRVNNEQFSALDLDSAFEIPSFGPGVFEARYYNHLRNRSAEGLAEILMFQNGLLTTRRSGGSDRYRDWRLDVDNMTYEELLELGDRIGHVSTGLGEDQIGRCLRKAKLSVLHEMPSQPHISAEIEGKCSICQEEYEAEEEVAKLECEHAYHLQCIEQWLVRKNACPVCKAEASSL